MEANNTNIIEDITGPAQAILEHFRRSKGGKGVWEGCEGLWLFKYNRQLTQLETWEIIPKYSVSAEAANTIKSLKPEILGVKIAKGEGSIGYVIESGKRISVVNVSSDPRGVVSLIDEKIGQKSAFLVPIFLDKRKRELLGVLDFYFSNDNLPGKNHKWSIPPRTLEIIRLIYQRDVFKEKFQKMCRDVQIEDFKDPSEANLKSLAAIHDILQTVAPIPLIGYSSSDAVKKEVISNKRTRTTEAIKFQALKIDFSYFRRLFLNELQWCCYCKAICSNCLLSESNQISCDSKEGGGIVKLMASIYTENFLKRTILLADGWCKIMLFWRKDAGDFKEHNKLDRLIYNCFSPVLKSLVYSRGKQQQDSAHLLAEIIFNSGKISPAVFNLIFSEIEEGLRPSLEDINAAHVLAKKLEIASAFIMARPNVKWICDELPYFKAKHLIRFQKKLKLSSSIKPLYAALFQGEDSLGNYPPLVTADKVSVSLNKQDLSGVFRFNVSGKEINWKWKRVEDSADTVDFVYGYVSADILERRVAGRLIDSPEDFEQLKSLMGLETRNSFQPKDSAFYLYPKTEISKSEEGEIVAHISRLNNIYQTKIQKEKALQNGRKSAVASIMARNMSHNIGSHVLNYLSDKDKFYGYLRDKMNFITEIVTSSPKWGVQMEFLTEVLAPFFGVRSGRDCEDYEKAQIKLLDNIFRSEMEANFPITKLEIRYQETGFKDCGSMEKSHLRKQISWGKSGKRSALKFGVRDGVFNRIHTENRSQVLMPHGVIGCHALYSFLEGYIRNSAKHNRAQLNKSGSSFVINIALDWEWGAGIKELSPRVERFARLRLSDNISEFKSNDSCVLKNCPCDKPEKYRNCIRHINNLVSEELINQDTGAITNSAWGLKELLLCAKWLRKIPAGDISAAEPPILKLLPDDIDPKKGFWELYLLKPQHILFVGPAFIGNKEDKINGIYWDADKNTLENRIAANELSHTFVVLDGTNPDLMNWLGKGDNLRKLPQRLFVVDGPVHGKVLPYIPMTSGDIGFSGKKLFIALYKRLAMWLNGEVDLPKIHVIGEDNPRKVKGDLFVTITKQSNDLLKKISSRNGICFSHKPFLELDSAVLESFSYRDGFSTASATTSLPSLLGAAESDESIQYQICEFALLRVLIIDERLFRDVKAEREIPKVGKAALHSHWERMGVRFATLTGAGIVKNFKSDSVSLENFLRGARFDFISIHQALISDVIKGEWGKTLEMLRKATRNIIIHSARGDVSVLKGFKFIDYSNLRNVLIDRPDKQALADRLMSLTGEGGKT